jgi:ABC-type transporter Mla subunit MlaD/ElaB/YqjD/DUF883 family membrane-anchored ribosome-binding protein
MAIPGDGGNVVIKIKFNVDDKSLAAAKAKIKALGGESSGAAKDLTELSGAFDNLSDDSDRSTKSLDNFTRKLDKGDNKLRGATRSTKRMMVAAIGAVNGVLWAGQALLKTYQWLMKGVAYGVGAATVAVGLLTAAQREYNASLQSFRYTSAPHLGSGTNQAMSAMRMLTSDTKLAVFGMESLNATFAAVSQNAELTGPLKQALRGLGDFAVAAGGDIGKNLTSLGTFIGLLQKSGSLTDEVVAAADQVGGKFGESIANAKKMGITSADALMKMFSSGEFAKLAGLEGALDAVNNTLMGQLKSYFTLVQGQFADFGQFFLPQTKRTLEQLYRVFGVTFTRISGTVMSVFGNGKLMNDLLNVFSRLADFTANIVDKYLPQSGGMLDGIKSAIQFTMELFYKMKSSLESFSEAGKIVTDALGPVVKTISQGFGDSFRDLRTYLVENRDEFIDFGDALAGAFETLRSAIEMIKDAWQGAVPTITSVLRIFERLGFLFEGMSWLLSLGGQQPSDQPQSASQTVGDTVGGLLSNYASVATLGGVAVLSSLRADKKGKKGGMMAGAGRGIRNLYGGRGSVSPHALRMQQMQAANAFNNVATGQRSRIPLNSQTAGIFGRGAGMGFTGAAPLAIGGQLAMLGLGDTGGDNAAFMAAGGVASFINPMAGLAVSGLGTATTSDNAIKGGLAGAMGGAAAGALVGSVVPGVGTALGAGIGGAAGLAYGATMGGVRQAGIGQIGSNDALWKDAVAAIPLFGQVAAFWNDAHMRDLTADRARETVTTGVSRAGRAGLIGGVEAARKEFDKLNQSLEELTSNQAQFTGKNEEERRNLANQMLREGKISQETARAFSERYESTFIDEKIEATTEAMEVRSIAEGELGRKLKGLTEITGLTEEQIGQLAITTGTDLYDGAQSLTGALEQLGLASVKSAEEVNAAIREIYALNIERIFGARSQVLEGQNLVTQAGEAFRQLGGGGTEEELNVISQDILRGVLLWKEADPVAALQWLEDAFGPNGHAYSQPGGPFENAPQQTGIQQFVAETSEGMASVLGANFTTSLATMNNVGMSMGDRGMIEQVLAGKAGTEEQRALLGRQVQFLTAFGAGLNPETGQALQGEEAAKVIEGTIGATLQSIFPEGTPFDAQGLAAQDDAAAAIKASMSEGAQEMYDKLNEVVADQKEAPYWWHQAPGWFELPPDSFTNGINSAVYNGVREALLNNPNTPPTAPDTPTSRLARTMGRHNFYDNQFAGKRTVTSAWRNTNLGSINSDHVTGNAYDLIGQNLGAYATMVNQTGGFAEFHGVGGARHLHVVPGQTPVGDTIAPIPAAAIAVGGSGSTAYNITVNAAQGQDPNAIAAAVMSRIDERDRNMRERR